MKIHVANLALETTSADLRAAFAGVGEVKSARVIYDRVTGRSRGFGFVEMTNQDEASAAIVALGQAQLQGQRLRLSESLADDANQRR
jgi:RNA recognition motif-containing protein